MAHVYLLVMLLAIATSTRGVDQDAANDRTEVWTRYNSERLAFAVDRHIEWTVREDVAKPHLVAFQLRPADPTSSPGALSVALLPRDMGDTLDAVVENTTRWLSELLSDARVIASEPFEIAGQPGHRIVSEGTRKGLPMRFTHIITLRQSNAYLITHVDVDDREVDAAIVQRFVSSFEITGEADRREIERLDRLNRPPLFVRLWDRVRTELDVNVELPAPMVSYSNRELDFRVKYPRNWGVKEDAEDGRVVFTPPDHPTRGFTEHLSVIVTKTRFGDGELHDFMRASAEVLRQEFPHLDERNARYLALAGVPAHRAEYFVSRENGMAMVTTQISLLKGGRAYVISYSTVANEAPRFADVVEQVFESFELID